MRVHVVQEMRGKEKRGQEKRGENKRGNEKGECMVFRERNEMGGCDGERENR